MISKENFYAKGRYSTSVSNITLVKGSDRVWKLTPASSINITLPDATTLAEGAIHFIIINYTDVGNNIIDIGAYEYQYDIINFTIKDNGGNTVKSLTGKTAILCTLIDNSTSNGTWVFVERSVLEVSESIPMA